MVDDLRRDTVPSRDLQTLGIGTVADDPGHVSAELVRPLLRFGRLQQGVEIAAAPRDQADDVLHAINSTGHPRSRAPSAATALL